MTVATPLITHFKNKVTLEKQLITRCMIQMYLYHKTYTVSPFMNISGLSLIKLVRTQESNPFMVNWKHEENLIRMPIIELCVKKTIGQ
jgi:hypothetical protein